MRREVRSIGHPVSPCNTIHYTLIIACLLQLSAAVLWDVHRRRPLHLDRCPSRAKGARVPSTVNIFALGGGGALVVSPQVCRPRANVSLDGTLAP